MFKAKHGQKIRLLTNEDHKGHTFKQGEELFALVYQDGFIRANYTGKMRLKNLAEAPYCLLAENQYELVENLSVFPEEGCCITKDQRLVSYLLNRPLNRPDNTTNKDNAVGIGWNKTSYWWLVTPDKSSKKKYELSELEKFLPKQTQEFEVGKLFVNGFAEL